MTLLTVHKYGIHVYLATRQSVRGGCEIGKGFVDLYYYQK